MRAKSSLILQREHNYPLPTNMWSLATVMAISIIGKKISKAYQRKSVAMTQGSQF